MDHTVSACSAASPPRKTTAIIYRRALTRIWFVNVRSEAPYGQSVRNVPAEDISCSLGDTTPCDAYPSQEIVRTYRTDELSLGMEPVDSKEFVPWFASDLAVPEKV